MQAQPLDPARLSPAGRAAYSQLSPDSEARRTIREIIAGRLSAGEPVSNVRRTMRDDARYSAAFVSLKATDPGHADMLAFVDDLVRIEAEDARPRLRLVF